MSYDYTIEEVRRAVAISLGVLLRNDSLLFVKKASERSVSHKLAEYLQKRFPDWDVDCEYNRKGPHPKLLEGIRKCSGRRRTDRIFPDIIVHKRSTNANMLVIEMKINADNSCDIAKLKLLTDRHYGYSYKLGLFIKFDTKGNPSLKWFRDGKELTGNLYTKDDIPVRW